MLRHFCTALIFISLVWINPSWADERHDDFSIGSQRQFPNRSSESMFGRGLASFSRHQYRDSLQEFEQAIEIANFDARYWYFKALCELKIGNLADAGHSRTIAQKLEALGYPSRKEVARSLETIQGSDRRWLASQHFAVNDYADFVAAQTCDSGQLNQSASILTSLLIYQDTDKFQRLYNDLDQRLKQPEFYRDVFSDRPEFTVNGDEEGNELNLQFNFNRSLMPNVDPQAFEEKLRASINSARQATQFPGANPVNLKIDYSLIKESGPENQTGGGTVLWRGAPPADFPGQLNPPIAMDLPMPIVAEYEMPDFQMGNHQPASSCNTQNHFHLYDSGNCGTDGVLPRERVRHCVSLFLSLPRKFIGCRFR
jgi:hypothetical protein